MAKSKPKPKPGSKNRDGFSYAGWALAVISVVFAVKAFHSYQAISAIQSVGIELGEKKKRQANRINEHGLSGGARHNRDEEQKSYHGKMYYANLAMRWNNLGSRR